MTYTEIIEKIQKLQLKLLVSRQRKKINISTNDGFFIVWISEETDGDNFKNGNLYYFHHPDGKSPRVSERNDLLFSGFMGEYESWNAKQPLKPDEK